MRSKNQQYDSQKPDAGEQGSSFSGASRSGRTAPGASESGGTSKEAKTSPAKTERKGIGRAGIAATAILLVLAVIAGIQLEQSSTIQEVRFSGYEFTTDEELAAVLPFQNGISADSVNFMDIVKKVNSLPYIRSSEIYLEANGVMVVEVNERTPVALLVSNEELAYVDGEGIFLPVVLGKPVDVPLLYGFRASSEGDTLLSETFSQVRQFLNEIRENEFAWVTISEVAYNGKEGVVALNHENGVKLIFGEDNFDQKLKFWETFYSDVVRSRGIESFSYVDFRFRNQIITHEI